MHFKKVLVLINTPGNNYSDFHQLIEFIFRQAGQQLRYGKTQKVTTVRNSKDGFFHCLSLFQGGQESGSRQKMYPFAILRLWQWILENSLEKDKEILDHFKKNAAILLQVFEDYFTKTLPVAIQKNGLMSEAGGKYEQIGYPLRTMEYLSHLLAYFHFQYEVSREKESLAEEQLYYLIELLNKNDGTTRPFFTIIPSQFAWLLTF